MIKKRAFSVLYMFVLTLVITSVVTVIYAANKHRIAVNEKIKLSKVILGVLKIEMPPRISDDRVNKMFERRIQAETLNGKRYYRGLSKDGKKVIGYVIPLEGPGLWGQVYGMMGVDPQLKKVIGVAFYRHSETPGLGGRITEPWFVMQFEGRPLKPTGEEKRYFIFVPPGKEKSPNDVDAITGATLTSQSVQRFMNRNLHDYLPLIAKQKAQKHVSFLQ